MSSRLKLENLIFARAAWLRTEIFSQNGALFCARADALLRAWLQTYNAFFAAENRRRFGTFSSTYWADFCAQQEPYWGGLVPFQNTQSEIFFEQRLAAARAQKKIDKKNKL